MYNIIIFGGRGFSSKILPLAVKILFEYTKWGIIDARRAIRPLFKVYVSKFGGTMLKFGGTY